MAAQLRESRAATSAHEQAAAAPVLDLGSAVAKLGAAARPAATTAGDFEFGQLEAAAAQEASAPVGEPAEEAHEEAIAEEPVELVAAPTEVVPAAEEPMAAGAGRGGLAWAAESGHEQHDRCVLRALSRNHVDAPEPLL